MVPPVAGYYAPHYGYYTSPVVVAAASSAVASNTVAVAEQPVIPSVHATQFHAQVEIIQEITSQALKYSACYGYRAILLCKNKCIIGPPFVLIKYMEEMYPDVSFLTMGTVDFFWDFYFERKRLAEYS